MLDLAQVRIVTDSDAWMRDGLKGDFPMHLHGVPVVDWREVEVDPPGDTTRVYFLANNDKHVFAHRMLARQSQQAKGRVVSVLHDPSMFMVHEHMMRTGEPEFALDRVSDIMTSQLGTLAPGLLRGYANGWLPDAISFGVHCMGNALSRSDEIWTHSVFGANRVLYENDFTGMRCAAIRVCAHPREKEEAGEAVSAPRRDDHFNIGVFGWVTPPKRVASVIKGVALALDRLKPSERARVRLRIVGKRPPVPDYDVVDMAMRLGLRDHVEFVDYPPQEEFARYIRESDLVFNLRYPSCGETSGTLVSAQTHNIRVVASRYQAFREATGIWRFINVSEPYEIWDIADAVVDAIREPAQALDTVASTVAPIETLVARLVRAEFQETL
ncbi:MULTISPECIES: glycosyltransferase [unclassified Brevundimonas]|uniref:glycosyltransferase n=1 Tax=unclassified Brevundimonas TaxID=2622653 RepID=UPI0025BEB27C|nr:MULTISPECIES: glycosyltransferase [unclassified Brevundimonas]